VGSGPVERDGATDPLGRVTGSSDPRGAAVAKEPSAPPALRMGTGAGRWLVGVCVLGSGIAFIDGTVVNAALPAIAADLGADLADLQWVITGYLLTLSAFVVLGGSLGDRYGRKRVFLVGLAAFALTSLLCSVAPTVTVLIGARLVQGIAAALLLPSSLALISASFATTDRGAALGAWSGLGGIAGAIGPFLGGWLISAISWRAVFLINLPLCAIAIVLAMRHVPETLDVDAPDHLDLAGASTLAIGLGGVVYALIEGPAAAWPPASVIAGALGIVALVGFVVIERTSSHPMVPLDLFASRQFSGANATTLFVYASIGATTFFVVVYLQTGLGYSPLEAGAVFLPLTAFMLLFSARSGALAQRIGPRWPMTIGSFIVAIGVALFARVEPTSSYVATVLPATLVLGLGLTLTVAPLTTAVLAAVADKHAGVGSAVNNAVARIGSLLAVAVLPALAGLTDETGALDLDGGFTRAMLLAAALALIGSAIACATVRRSTPVGDITVGNLAVVCLDPCVKVDVEAEAA
jgi:EmrB/QacA subfamily drug resistance transporter